MDLVTGQFIGWFYDTKAGFKRDLRQFCQEFVKREYSLLVVSDTDGADHYLSVLAELEFNTGKVFTLSWDEICSKSGEFSPELAANGISDVQTRIQHEQKSSLCVFLDLNWVLAAEHDYSDIEEFGSRLLSLVAKSNFIIVGSCGRQQVAPSDILDTIPSFSSILYKGEFRPNPWHSPEERALAPERSEVLVEGMLQFLRDSPDQTKIGALGSRNTLQLLEAIIDSMGFGVVVGDTKGNMIVCNKTGEKILGYGLSKLPLEQRVRKFGNYLPDKVTPYPVDELPISRAIRGESDDDVEIFIRNEKKPEGVWVSTTGRPIRDKKGAVKGGVLVFRDITAEKAAIEKNARLEARMIQTQKMEGLGLLAGGIAHDFNNLLMGVLGNAGLALLESEKDSLVYGRLGQIKTGAMRLSELTRQLLAYSGQGSFTEVPVSLSDVVEEIQELLRTVVSKKAVVEGEFPKDIPKIKGDPTQIRQLVINLIMNASDALEHTNGSVKVRTGIMYADREFLLNTLLAENLEEGSYVFLEVSDTGCGMDLETMKRIFDPFFTTKRKGRGLGLAAVLGLVRRHGAALNVESVVGEGSTFTVIFPPLEGLIVEETKKPSPTGIFRGDGLILVIDDEEVVRYVTREILEFSGFRVLSAANGTEGIELFEEHASEILAVLLDVSMPDLGGDEVFCLLREIRKDVKVILSSGYDKNQSTDELFAKGLAGFLQKPYVPELLLAKIKEVTGGQDLD